MLTEDDSRTKVDRPTAASLWRHLGYKHQMSTRPSTTSFEQITYDVTDPVGTITLNRPEAYNAFTPTMGREIREAFALAERNPAVVGIILTGAGKGFCAGADMKSLQRIGDPGDSGGSATSEDEPAGGSLGDPDESHPLPGDPSWGDDLRGTYTYLMSIPKPIVGAINGAVAGMGVPIALSCDLRFMNADAVLTTAFGQRGLIAEWGLAWLLGRLAGPANACDLLFSSRRVKGSEAAAMGLVNWAVPAERVLPAAREYVETLAKTVSPASIATMKRQVYQGLHSTLGAHEKEAIELMRATLRGPDFVEGVQSYLHKREPDFPRLDVPARS